jgi:hypothetical protein
MAGTIKITAVIGSYRTGGIIDRAVDELLAAAREEGAKTGKILLVDRQIEFCTNCRQCMLEEGAPTGRCPLADEMGSILYELDCSDAFVLASPTNFGTVTAVMKRFIERLACYAYWPWGMKSPRLRVRKVDRPAVVIASSAAPSLIARLITRTVGILRKAVEVMGGRTVGVLFIGLAAQQPNQALSTRTVEKARSLGRELVASARRMHG